MTTLRRRTLLASAATLLPGASTQVRIMWYSDGNEGEVLRSLLDRFEAANPDVKVILDAVSYKTISEDLPALVGSGQAPDMARVTDLRRQSDSYLDIGPLLQNRAAWEKNFADVLPWLRPADNSTGIFGLMTQLTVTMPIVNETLFKQAGIALPGATATWRDWGDAAKSVAQTLNVAIPIAVDRTGQAIAGPAISRGAKFFDGDTPEIADDGFRETMQMFYDWHRDGVMSKRLWGSVGGASFRGANEEFATGRVVLYMTGNWQFAQFARTIGNAFNWHGVPNPCGPAACSGMPGGAALVAYKTTKHPREVARIFDYLASDPVYAEYHARTLFLTASTTLAAKGIAYQADLPQVQNSLAAATANVRTLSPIAYRLQGYPRNRMLFNTMIVRLNQAIAGEISLDTALARMASDIAVGLK